MKRFIIFLLALFVVLIPVTFAEALPQTLTVYCPMGEEAGNAAFAERCPEVSLQFEGSLSKEDIFTLVLTQSSEIDLFGSNSFNLPVYRELISREFYAPIESPTLRSFAEDCYPGVRDVLFVGDQLVGVPVWCLQAYQVGVEKSMWRELGLSEESLPRTYLELIDFIQNQWPALADAHPDWCAMRSDNYWLLFHELLSDYSVYRRRAAEDPGYDTEVFRNVLTAYLSVPAELSEDDANKTPIFSAQLQLSTAAPDIFSTQHYEFLPIGFTDESEPTALVTLGLMVINPYSQNRELCETYLECLVENMDPIQRTTLQRNCTEPVLWPGWEEFYAEYSQTLEDYQAKIAAAKDASAQSDLQAELDAYIDDNVYLLSNQWTVSPESLEEYHQVVQDQVVMWDDALNAREVELFQELCNNVYERTIPVDAIVTQLNRLYYFRTLEDS